MEDFVQSKSTGDTLRASELKQSTTAIKNSFDRIHDDMAELKQMIRALTKNRIPTPPPATSSPEPTTARGETTVRGGATQGVPTPTHYGNDQSFNSSQPRSTTWQLQWEESDRRFYRELNDIKIGLGRPPVLHPCDPMMNQVYERTIFVKIHREFFAISDEILYEVFSGYGIIDWVERLSRGFHSTILFRDKESTLWAFELLNGLNLYGDCCQLELFLAKQPEERSTSSASTSRDESVGFQELVNPKTTSSEESTMAIEVQTSIDLVEIQIQSEFPEMLANDNIRGSFESLEIKAQEIEDKGSVEVEATIEESSQEDIEASVEDTKVPSPAKLQIQFEMPKVTHRPLNALVFEEELKRMAESIEVEVSIETETGDIWNVYNPFDEMPKRSINVLGHDSWIFDPGGVRRQDYMSLEIVADRVIRRKDVFSSSYANPTIVDRHMVLARKLVFDPGILESCEPSRSLKGDGPVVLMKGVDMLRNESDKSCIVSAIEKKASVPCFWKVAVEYDIGVMIIVFDPGGALGVATIGVRSRASLGHGIDALAKLVKLISPQIPGLVL